MQSKFESARESLRSLFQNAFESEQYEHIEKEWEHIDCSEQEKRSIFDCVLKDHILEISSSLDQVKRLVTLAIQLSRTEVCSASMPVVLLSDAFDIFTLSDCETLFAFVEEHVSVWKDDLFFSSSKNNLLRMCNDLLRRLSRSQNTVFRGRILLFLASFFPFSERSGLNLVSEFNLESANEYKREMLSEPMKVEEEQGEEKETHKVDYNLYNKFLTLQDFFKNPTQCYNKSRWGTFALSWADTFQTFQNLKLDAITTSRKVNPENMPEGGSGDAVFFAKYLTNPRLLQLQLGDPNFRRSLIIQGLIILQYLTSPVKSKLDSYELNPVQQEWVKEQESVLYNLLAETPRGSGKFRDMVKHFLNREHLWNNWKNESCQEFKRLNAVDDPSSENPRHYPKKRNIGDVLKNAAANGKYIVGSRELNKLWNMNPNNMQACLSQERAFVPTMESYLGDAASQLDPAAAIEDQYKLINDSDFRWRALRLLIQRSSHFFAPMGNSAESKVPDILEHSLKQMIKKQQPQAVSEEIEIIKDEADEPTPAATDPEEAKLGEDAIEGIASRLGEDWTRLASKLSYTVTTPQELVKIWIAEDEDATPENVAYMLEGMKFDEAAEYVKSNWCKQEG